MPACWKPRKAPLSSRPSSLREHRWSATERAVFVCFLAIAMGVLFLASYTLLLGDPVPRRIDAALVGDQTTHAATVDAVGTVANVGAADVTVIGTDGPWHRPRRRTSDCPRPTAGRSTTS
jgi:hypothetical protein